MARLRSFAWHALALGLLAGSALYGIEETVDDSAFLGLYREERWSQALAVALERSRQEPHSVLWTGYCAAVEFRLNHHEEAAGHLRLLRALGGRPDRNQLAMEWESLIRIGIFDLAGTVLDEVRRRYPTCTLARTSDERITKAADPPDDEEERIRFLLRRMATGRQRLANDTTSAGRWRRLALGPALPARAGMAFLYGDAWLAWQAASGLEPRSVMRMHLALANLALDLQLPGTATSHLGSLPADGGDEEVALARGRLAWMAGDQVAAAELVRSILGRTRDLAIKTQARQLLRTMGAPER